MNVRTLKRKLAASLLHPYFLCVLNFLMLILFYSSIKITLTHLDSDNHFQEPVELWEGYGTILLGLGVILEEHSSLGHILGVHLKPDSEEDAVEKVCHDYGVIFVVLGVIVEVFAWLVKIPNVLLDSYIVELTFINIAALAATLCAVLQIKFLREILQAHSKTKKS